MMNEALKEVEARIKADVGTTAVKAWYVGDAGLVPGGTLPAVIVRERGTKITRVSTSKDQCTFSISILVVVDMRADFKTAARTNDLVAHRERLRKLVEEADTDGAPKTTTILGSIMRQANLHGTNYVWNMNPVVNYYPEVPGGFFYAAAEITLDLITDLVTRKA